VSPEAAAGGPIALVRDGDRVVIDIPSRTISLDVAAEELDRRRQAERFVPEGRDRFVSAALRAYAAHASSADKGGVRKVES